VIALSTLGDNEEEVEMNWIWFRNKWKKNSVQMMHQLKALSRPVVDHSQGIAGKVIAIGPTHINDRGARVNNTNIANTRDILTFILYHQKRKAIQGSQVIMLTDEQKEVLGVPLKDWMAADVIDTA